MRLFRGRPKEVVDYGELAQLERDVLGDGLAEEDIARFDRELGNPTGAKDPTWKPTRAPVILNSDASPLGAVISEHRRWFADCANALGRPMSVSASATYASASYEPRLYSPPPRLVELPPGVRV